MAPVMKRLLLFLFLIAGCNVSLGSTQTMAVEIRGQGTVEADWGTICQRDCTFTHEPALYDEDGHDICMIPAEGWQFDHWERDCASLEVDQSQFIGGGAVACTHIYFSGDMNCTAVFMPLDPPANR